MTLVLLAGEVFIVAPFAGLLNVPFLVLFPGQTPRILSKKKKRKKEKRKKKVQAVREQSRHLESLPIKTK